VDRKTMIQALDRAMGSDRQYFESTTRFPFQRNPIKSYLLETNVSGGFPEEAVVEFLRSDMVATSVEIEPTDDPTIHVVQIGKSKVQFYLDSLDMRFWVLHSQARASESDGAVRSLVQRSRYLDSVWLPTRFFESVISSLGIARQMTAKFSVPTGLYQDILPDDDYLDESLVLRIGSATGNALDRWQSFSLNEGVAPSLALWNARVVRHDIELERLAIDDITASGKATARGNSFVLHQEMLITLKNRYAELIKRWEERYRLDWKQEGQGLEPRGTTAVITFPEPLAPPSLERLAEAIFSGGEPYRLYGVPRKQSENRIVVRGIDLHTGARINFELTEGLMRAYLFPATCGNVLARLVTNLQHYHDARVDLDEDSE
jgi:hypothetical protein